MGNEFNLNFYIVKLKATRKTVKKSTEDVLPSHMQVSPSRKYIGLAGIYFSLIILNIVGLLVWKDQYQIKSYVEYIYWTIRPILIIFPCYQAFVMRGMLLMATSSESECLAHKKNH